MEFCMNDVQECDDNLFGKNVCQHEDKSIRSHVYVCNGLKIAKVHDIHFVVISPVGYITHLHTMHKWTHTNTYTHTHTDTHTHIYIHSTKHNVKMEVFFNFCQVPKNPLSLPLLPTLYMAILIINQAAHGYSTVTTLFKMALANLIRYNGK